MFVVEQACPYPELDGRDADAFIQEVMDQHTVRAPAPGMVIYAREWNGRKKAVGSQVSPWEPTVATLPDLSGRDPR